MTNYEIWSYDWKNELTRDERRLFKFDTFIELMNYAKIRALAHKVATIYYDRATDTMYMEE